MNKAVVFDMDGTLVDSRQDIADGVNLLRQRLGFRPLAFDTVISYTGDGVKRLIERSCADMPGKTFKDLYDPYMAAYMETLTCHTHFYDGALECIARLKAEGWKIAVSSNKPESLCKQIIKVIAPENTFDTIVGGRPDLPVKPSPLPILCALAECGNADVSVSWMVGDSFNDICAGRSAGLKTIRAMWGFGRIENETPDFEAETFEKAADIILKGSAE